MIMQNKYYYILAFTDKRDRSQFALKYHSVSELRHIYHKCGDYIHLRSIALIGCDDTEYNKITINDAQD